MTLAKSKISMPFVNGINTKSDNKQLTVGVLEVAENVAFETPGKLKKSNGYEAISVYDINNTKLTGIKSLASFNTELNAITHNDMYAYSENIKKWINKGKLVDIKAVSSLVAKNEKEQSQLDCIFIENTKIFVYKDSTGVRYSVVDNINGATLVHYKLVSASGVKPRLARIGNMIFIIYSETSSIFYKTFNIVNPLDLSSAVKIIDGDLGVNDNFDVASTSNGKITVVYNNAIDVLSLFQIGSDLVLSSIIAVTGESAAACVDINVDYKDRLLISFSSGSDIKLIIYSSNFSAVSGVLAIETIANVTKATAQYNGSTVTVFYEVSAVLSQNYLVHKNTVSYAGVVGTPEVFLRSVGIAGKAVYSSNLLFIPLMHNSTLQSSYFIVDSSGSVINTISSDLGGDFIECSLPHVCSFDSTAYLFTSQVKGRIVTDTGFFETLLGVNSTTLNVHNVESTSKKALANNLHLPSGILYMYDSTQVVEHGYFIYPENLTATSAAIGGSLVNGTYQYCAIYNWTDSQGQQHMSNPSIPVSITLSGGVATQLTTVVVPTLRLTSKNNVVVDLYRTENAGTLFYKVTTVISPVLNNPAADTVSIADGKTDIDLVSGEILYTTGGVLENIIAPQSSIIESFGSRIFLAGLEDGNKIIYSKIRNEGKPVEFNDTLYTIVDPFGGRIVSLINMDDKLIILKERALYYMSGKGPNNLGAEDDFITPELISSDMGCVNRDSVVLTSTGIMFKSEKGIYQLARDLSISYIGDKVEKFNRMDITSADVISDKNVIRFTTNEGACLVYNYYVAQWATYTNFSAIDAEIVGSNYYYLRPDSSIYMENSSYSNNGTPISMKVETAWLNLSGTVQGFMRVYRMLLLGDFKSSHKLKIKIAYDFKEIFIQETIINVADFINSSAYGDSSPYGSDTLYGGDGNLYQLRVNFSIQKCQAIKISIEDISDVEGEAYSLSTLLFTVGIKANNATVNKANNSTTL